MISSTSKLKGKGKKEGGTPRETLKMCQFNAICWSCSILSWTNSYYTKKTEKPVYTDGIFDIKEILILNPCFNYKIKQV